MDDEPECQAEVTARGERVYCTGETKWQIQERVDREGRWPEFIISRKDHRRAEVLRREKALGRRLTEPEKELVNDWSWGAALLEFMPDEELAAAEAARVGEEDDPWLNQEVTIDFIADIEWVYQNIGRVGLRKRDCPSSGAWEMLSWAKGRREKFYEQMVPKALAQRDKKEEVGEGEGYDFSMLDKLLEEGE
jgi:hypothetical protein